MPRDYKSRSKSSNIRGNGPSSLVWFFTGILVGLIIAGVFYLKNQKTQAFRSHQRQERQIIPKTQITQKTQIQPPAPVANHQTLQTQFDFYHDLTHTKNNNTPVPIQTPAPITVPAPAAPPSIKTPAPASSYIVQAGIFSAFRDADQLRAQLLLLGFNVHVSPTEASSHLQRVWIGPFAQKAKAISVQHQLKQNQIASSVLKSALPPPSN